MLPRATVDHRPLYVAGIFLLVCWALPALALPDETVRREIGYLLTRLETSGCEFFRNGDWYDAVRARKHIERKYVWLVKRDLVASTEQFIERAATQSSRSGEPYLVRCPGESAIPSAVWLHEELGEYRNGPGGRE
jgi:hypothetical protein